ncbi:MAG: hypothetical protein FWH02_08475 [Oscillospiraceae bacterium]|nr:hypothetical protein [Oscillospiraceae bacterium]
MLSGGDVKSVQRVLGDKTADMVLKVYGRSLDKQYRSMNEKFDEVFYGC